MEPSLEREMLCLCKPARSPAASPVNLPISFQLSVVVVVAISDPIQEAKANAILQSAQELFAPLNPTVNFAVDDDFLSKRDAMRPMLANRFQELSNCLAENGMSWRDATRNAMPLRILLMRRGILLMDSPSLK